MTVIETTITITRRRIITVTAMIMTALLELSNIYAWA
jgi:hypothetical protein